MSPSRARRFPFVLMLSMSLAGPGSVPAATGVHTTWLWHMHQPIYWPTQSTWTPGRYETAYETITLGHSQNDEFSIFNSDDRVADYQWYPRDALNSVLDLSDAGAPVLATAGGALQGIGDGSVVLMIHDARGRTVRRLVGSASGGQAAFTWDGRDESGRNLASGNYFARVAGPPGAAARLTLVK